jgi:hypothetical protein
MVQRLESNIAKALERIQDLVNRDPTIILNAQDDQAALEIQESMARVQDTWLDNHVVLEGDGKARCSFHFCKKLFRDVDFLRKHLVKKHGEFLNAEQAKCHDPYMMTRWDESEHRPVPDLQIDCGNAFPNVTTPVQGRIPQIVDPEPALWEAQQARLERKRQQQEEYRQRVETPAPVRTFVDVDDVKVEKVALDFTEIDHVPVVTTKKKKRKLL